MLVVSLNQPLNWNKCVTYRPMWPTYLSFYLPIYRPTYLHSYLPTYFPTYLPTYDDRVKLVCKTNFKLRCHWKRKRKVKINFKCAAAADSCRWGVKNSLRRKVQKVQLVDQACLTGTPLAHRLTYVFISFIIRCTYLGTYGWATSFGRSNVLFAAFPHCQNFLWRHW